MEITSDDAQMLALNEKEKHHDMDIQKENDKYPNPLKKEVKLAKENKKYKKIIRDIDFHSVNKENHFKKIIKKIKKDNKNIKKDQAIPEQELVPHYHLSEQDEAFFEDLPKNVTK